MSDSELGSPTPEGDDWEPHLGSLIGGIAVGAVLLGAVWLFVAGLPGVVEKAKSPNAAEPSATLSVVPTTTSQSQAPGPTRLDRCTDAADVVERSLQQARPALDQWEVHVGAMNKLVVGSITLQQATAFWNQTRVGAYDRIGRFENAEAQLDRRGVDCAAPRLLGSGASPALRACAQHVNAELRALDSARTAITTWKHHMQAMDQLRSGKLSPTAATQMWLTMWQRGVHELEGFRTAADAAQHVGACDGTAGTSQPSASHPREPGSSPMSPSSPTASPMSGMDMR
jgi:hypothetical protein